LFPLPFEELLTLHLDLTGGHGDDASPVHQMLHSTHKLTSLSLQLHSCDLENCRVQGITYDYHFPDLESFSLQIWLDSRIALADSLLHHPSITALSLSLSTEDEDSMETTLPCLRALALNDTFRTQLFSNLLSASASRRITHLRLDGLHQGHLRNLAGVGRSLPCLELSTYSADGRREDLGASKLRELLLSLPELTEIALDCQSGNTHFRNEANEWVHPDPIDVDDLVC
jgi:hypothetical protein